MNYDNIVNAKVNNSLTLDNIISSAIRKRITRELNILESNPEFIHIKIEIDEKQILPILQVEDTKYKTNNIYTIRITNDYPFKPPKVEINSIPYSHFLFVKNSSPSVNYYLNKTRNIGCFCCNTVTCHSNWSPAVTSLNIFQEIRKYRKYKRDIINKIFSDKIKNKYLINDIDLDTWLFE